MSLLRFVSFLRDFKIQKWYDKNINCICYIAKKIAHRSLLGLRYLTKLSPQNR